MNTELRNKAVPVREMRINLSVVVFLMLIVFAGDAKALEPAQKKAICQQIEARTRAFEDLKTKIRFDLVNPVFAPPPNDCWKSGFSPMAHQAERNFVKHMSDLGLLLHKLSTEGKEGKLKELGEDFSRAYFGGIARAAECKDAALDPGKKDYYLLLKKNVEERFKELDQILRELKKVAAQL